MVCSIGTTDAWNAVGLGLDARVLAELGVRPVAVVAAVSAQDAGGLHALVALSPDAIRAQWASLAALSLGALRIGALSGIDAIRTVAEIARNAGLPTVYDPVLRASAGGRFASPAELVGIMNYLLPTTTICTPNLAEAAALSGRTVDDETSMVAAGLAIRARGARAVLVTGGHLAGDPIDALIDENGVRVLRGSRVPGEMRGTGCALGAAISANLARGHSLDEAVNEAREFVRYKLAAAVEVGGMRLAY